jgi:hypothetical protein
LFSGWLGAYWLVLPSAQFFLIGAGFALLAAVGLLVAQRRRILPRRAVLAAVAAVHGG